MRPGFYKGLHRVLRLACGAAGVYLVLKSYAVLGKGENASHVNAFLQQLEYEAQTAAVRQVLPGLLYPAQAGKTSESLTEGIVREAFRLMPLYRYAEQALLYEDGQEEEFSLAGEEALGTDGSPPSHNSQSGADGNGQSDQVTDNIESEGQIMNRSSEESDNLETNGSDDAMNGQSTNSDGTRSAGTGEDGQLPQTRVELADSGLPSTDAGTDGEAAVETSVQPAPGGIVYSAAQLADFDFLLDHFYTVDASTAISGALLDGEDLLSRDMTVDHSVDGPEILIYHSHSQEGFVDSEEGNLDTTIVGVGDYLTELLEKRYGYRVLHNREVFDLVDGEEDRNRAFTLSGNRVKELMEQYPSIQVILDLHRDGLSEDTHLVTDINGKPTARFMFFNGLSYSRKNGEISYLPNPYIADNLALTLQLQLKAQEYYPGVTRKIYLKTYRYNLHLCPKAMLVECGAQTNTLEEEKNACEPLASILHMVLQ